MIFHYNRYWPGATCGSNILTDNSINTDTNYVSSTSSQITFTRNVRARVVYSVEKIASGNVGQTLTPKINGNAVPGASPATLPTATNGHWTGSEVTGNLQEFTYSFKTNDALSFDFCVPDSGYNAFDIRIYALEGGGGGSGNAENLLFEYPIAVYNDTYTFTEDVNSGRVFVVGYNMSDTQRNYLDVTITASLNSATGALTQTLNQYNCFNNNVNFCYWFVRRVYPADITNVKAGDTLSINAGSNSFPVVMIDKWN